MCESVWRYAASGKAVAGEPVAGEPAAGEVTMVKVIMPVPEAKPETERRSTPEEGRIAPGVIRIVRIIRIRIRFIVVDR
jgi:hypothetical protein